MKFSLVRICPFSDGVVENPQWKNLNCTVRNPEASKVILMSKNLSLKSAEQCFYGKCVRRKYLLFCASFEVQPSFSKCIRYSAFKRRRSKSKGIDDKMQRNRLFIGPHPWNSITFFWSIEVEVSRKCSSQMFCQNSSMYLRRFHMKTQNQTKILESEIFLAVDIRLKFGMLLKQNYTLSN